MHVLNFLVTLILPYVSLFNNLRPPGSIPEYFLSDEAAFLAGEFYVLIFYWAGFLRNSVDRGALSERMYFTITFSTLIFICASKIVFALPYTWIISAFAFGLGVLSVTRGQWVGKVSLTLMIITSVIVIAFTGYILIGMAWFGYTPQDYYYYTALLESLFTD